MRVFPNFTTIKIVPLSLNAITAGTYKIELHIGKAQKEIAREINIVSGRPTKIANYTGFSYEGKEPNESLEIFLIDHVGNVVGKAIAPLYYAFPCLALNKDPSVFLFESQQEQYKIK